jgi:hypothetical protein
MAVCLLVLLDLALGGTDGIVLDGSDLAHDGLQCTVSARLQMECDRVNVKREDSDALAVCFEGASWGFVKSTRAVALTCLDWGCSVRATSANHSSWHAILGASGVHRDLSAAHTTPPPLTPTPHLTPWSLEMITKIQYDLPRTISELVDANANDDGNEHGFSHFAGT